MVYSILMVFAFVLTVLAAIIHSSPPLSSSTWRLPHLGWLGVSVWVLAILLGSR